MPEGDSIRRAAIEIRPVLDGELITSGWSRNPALAPRVVGRVVTSVETAGKHLMVHVGDDVVHIHLGMKGRVRTYRDSQAVRVSPATLSLRLDTRRGAVAWTWAPTVELLRTKDLARHPQLAALGPDLLARDVDLTVVLARAKASVCGSVAELLLDQRVACGVGNAVKNEALFMERLSPFAAVAACPDEVIVSLYRRAGSILRANVTPGPRRTTPKAVRSLMHVFERTARPCLVCATPVCSRVGSGSGARSGDAVGRITYWCPSCQIGPDGSGQRITGSPQSIEGTSIQ